MTEQSVKGFNPVSSALSGIALTIAAIAVAFGLAFDWVFADPVGQWLSGNVTKATGGLLSSPTVLPDPRPTPVTTSAIGCFTHGTTKVLCWEPHATFGEVVDH
ncbi:MAG: hypothetical protein JO293_09135 [Candidatus Eremiobacteraeota bacterium]|nr:hypothetical protein [Candidatus Eremiobacteraeota bacterium]MBV8223510.1 hypothetical protein [Candidatus Eremiobacteraeota bacterium]MBV8282533.1 hypothetical protein [Candidatus Eremiobacteraeota bacterium]